MLCEQAAESLWQTLRDECQNDRKQKPVAEIDQTQRWYSQIKEEYDNFQPIVAPITTELI